MTPQDERNGCECTLATREHLESADFCEAKKWRPLSPPRLLLPQTIRFSMMSVSARFFFSLSQSRATVLLKHQCKNSPNCLLIFLIPSLNCVPAPLLAHAYIAQCLRPLLQILGSLPRNSSRATASLAHNFLSRATAHNILESNLGALDFLQRASCSARDSASAVQRRRLFT